MGVSTLQLALTPVELGLLRGACDGVLNVPHAKATAQAFGRKRALEVLPGRDVEPAALATHPDNAVKARPLDMKPRQKKRSGRSNWPKTAAERSRVKQRTLERRAAGLDSPFALKSVETQPTGDQISP